MCEEMLANPYKVSYSKMKREVLAGVSETCLDRSAVVTSERTDRRSIWTYGIEQWGCSMPSNTKILQTFQSKMLRIISSAPWHVSNQTLHSDFEIQYVTEVVRINANKYNNRSTEHSNQLIRALLNPLADRRFKRLWPEDLAQ